MNSKIKAIIVDDESIVRKGLMATVNWNKFNIEIVADAPNGQKGLELFLEHKPQIVITDIVMPELNGLELSSKIKEVAPATKILLLSCHNDFKYAQQGIQIGASGYILKTAFDDEEFESYLAKFQKEIYSSHTTNPLEVEKRHSAFYAWLCGFNKRFKEELEQWMNHDWQWMKQPIWIYLIESTVQREASSIQEKFGFLENDFGIESEMIPCGDEQCFFFCKVSDKEKLNSFLIEQKSIVEDLRWNSLGPITDINEWTRSVRLLQKQSEIEKKYDCRINTWPDPIVQAVQLLVDDVQASFSVTEVANKVGLSRSHFSTLFKKVVGESFGTFYDKRRLDKASQLLETTDLNMQQIAETIGMYDAKHFSKWFKKYTNITPSHFRIKQKCE